MEPVTLKANQIVVPAEHPVRQFGEKDLPRSRKRKLKKRIVVARRGTGYALISGYRYLSARLEADEEARVTVEELGDDSEAIDVEGCLELYDCAAIGVIGLGKVLIRVRKVHDITQQELARRTGITPGTIHHYESCANRLAPELQDAVTDGRLAFKEARSLADLDDYDRQREIARPFVDGAMSSVHVERVVSTAKDRPDLNITEIIEGVMKNRPPRRKKDPEPEPEPKERLNGIQLADDLDTACLQLAGRLDSLGLVPVPEYKRLRLISTLRILQARTKTALERMAPHG